MGNLPNGSARSRPFQLRKLQKSRRRFNMRIFRDFCRRRRKPSAFSGAMEIIFTCPL